MSTLCQRLRKLEFSYQKLQHIALESERITFIAEVMAVIPNTWIDETGCDYRNALQKYGYGMTGQSPQDHQLQLKDVRYSSMSILSRDRINDVFITKGNINSDTFYGSFVLH